MLLNLVSRFIRLVIFLCSLFVSPNGFSEGSNLPRQFFFPWRLSRRPFVWQQAVSYSRKDRRHCPRTEESVASADCESASLFSCPVEGCVSTFQRHCNLERHMHYGKCIFVEERYSLLDKAKILYAEKLQEGSSAQPFIAGSELSEQSVQASPLWAGHCDLRRRLPVSVLIRRPTHREI